MKRDKDLLNCEMYIVNGIVVEFCDYFRKYPTISDVKRNFHFSACNLMTDADIIQVIQAVKDYDRKHNITL